MSMIIGRKQILLAALVLALGTAIFLNWRFSDSFNIAGAFNTSSSLGDTSLVSSTNSNASVTNYFATARLNREQTRDKAVEILKTQLTNSSVATTVKQSAETTIETIANNITKEGQIESLIKAKGFGDCMTFINEGQVNVVVKVKSGTTLTDSEIAQVDDIVIAQTKITANNIHIIVAK